MKDRGPNSSAAHKSWARKRMARPERHAAYGRGQMKLMALLNRFQ